MRVGECILFLPLFITYVAQAQRFHKKNHVLTTRFACRHREYSDEEGGLKSADVHAPSDDQLAIQDKAKPSQG